MIQGPTIRLRLIQNDEDEFIFQCMKDWPADAEGPYTRGRAQDRIKLAMQEHQNIEYPLQDNRWTDATQKIHGDCSDWFATFVIEHKGERVGVAHCRVIGFAVWVEWLSLLPERISTGLFREIRLAWSWLTFEILQGDRLGFATTVDNAPTMAVLGMYQFDRSKNVRNRGLNTDKEKEKGWHTRDHYERDRSTAFVDRDGNAITFEAT